MSVDVLPDDILLDIFDFCLDQPREFLIDRKMLWKRLAHVCRRWREIVFQSPRRLHLQILYTAGKPVSDMLDIWPALPLVISVGTGSLTDGMEDTIAALKHRDRIYRISIDFMTSSQLETLLSVMQESFLGLMSLDLMLHGMFVIPDSFLGGSAPHLRYLRFRSIPFPALPKLLLSATELVTLYLREIPHSGYFSPEAIVTALSALTNLESFELHFESPQSRPNRERRHPPSPARVVLPALTYFEFEGVSEYPEDVLAPGRCGPAT
jgi:hypothetical protein